MKYLFIILGFTGIVLVSYALQPPVAPAPAAPPVEQTLKRGMVVVASSTILVDIADMHQTRMQGLSGRTALPEGTGMLFIFDREAAWGIWMKDMRFSIDILWADSEGEIITIAHSVSPQTYPNSFVPARPARYVLEVPAGFAQKHGIVEGAQLVVQ